MYFGIVLLTDFNGGILVVTWFIRRRLVKCFWRSLCVSSIFVSWVWNLVNGKVSTVIEL